MTGTAGNGNGPPLANVLFCGDRPVGAQIAGHMVANGARIVGLGLNATPSPASSVIAKAAGVSPELIFYGRSMASSVALGKLARGAPDLGVCCGFAAILPPALLALPRWGWVNVHRSYLPYNRGLDPLQWAVVDGTPAGVTVHLMTEAIDAGDIIAQAEMPVLPTDGADDLEARADALAFVLFQSCWPRLRSGDLAGTPQDEALATYHSLAECNALRRLDRDATMKVGRLLDILRSYSGREYSAVELGVGLVRPRFAVHTEIRVAGQPAAGGERAGTDAAEDRPSPGGRRQAEHVDQGRPRPA